jgi:hypothetical protein
LGRKIVTALFESLPPNVQALLGVLLFGVVLAVQHLSAQQELRSPDGVGRAIFYWVFGVFVLFFGLAASIERPIAFAANLLVGFIYLGVAGKAYLNQKANCASKP